MAQPCSYLAVWPEAEQYEQCVTISREAYMALTMFVGDNKPAGSVTITFKNGNVAGVEIAMRSVLK